jgi:hypothetical protein
MDVDPNGSFQEFMGQAEEGEGPAAGMGGMMQDLAFAAHFFSLSEGDEMHSNRWICDRFQVSIKQYPLQKS